jgi:hypothetical protein
MHGRESDHFPAGFHDTLTPDECVEMLWWQDSFDFGERVIADADELDAYLADFVSAELAKRDFKPRRRWFVF